MYSIKIWGHALIAQAGWEQNCRRCWAASVTMTVAFSQRTDHRSPLRMGVFLWIPHIVRTPTFTSFESGSLSLESFMLWSCSRYWVLQIVNSSWYLALSLWSFRCKTTTPSSSMQSFESSSAHCFGFKGAQFSSLTLHFNFTKSLIKSALKHWISYRSSSLCHSASSTPSTYTHSIS